MVRYAFAAAAAALMLVAGGCGQSDGPSDAGSPSAAEPEESVNESPTPDPASPGGPSQPRGSAAEAVADLSQRLGAEPAQIGVVSVEEVTWRDGSLGCPRPGMMYPQVLTNGTRVVLEYGGQRYEYHAGGRRSAFLCDNPEPPAPR